MANQTNLTQVDWSALPAPVDDGAGTRIEELAVPSMVLPATDGTFIDLSISGRSVLFIYPMTGRPDKALPEGWDDIPGARGCTPQACSFRDMYAELLEAGAGRVFGLSAQTTDYQREAAERLHLPYLLLSDHGLIFADAMGLPRFVAGEEILLKRMTLVIEDGIVKKAFYPVFPPDQSAQDVLDWLRGSG